MMALFSLLFDELLKCISTSRYRKKLALKKKGFFSTSNNIFLLALLDLRETDNRNQYWHFCDTLLADQTIEKAKSN